MDEKTRRRLAMEEKEEEIYQDMLWETAWMEFKEKAKRSSRERGE